MSAERVHLGGWGPLGSSQCEQLAACREDGLKPCLALFALSLHSAGMAKGAAGMCQAYVNLLLADLGCA